MAVTHASDSTALAAVSREIFDVAVIGGGVVGCAVTRALTLAGARPLLIEKAADILAGASKANSALLHTGFDAPPDSLELLLVRQGHAEYLAIRDSLNLPLLATGALVVAWTDAETARLEEIRAQALANGVGDVSLLSRTATLELAPELASHLRAALLVPGESVIDPWSAPLAYLTQALVNGAAAAFGVEVAEGGYDGDHWTLRSEGGAVLRARHVVNCAGLYGDLVERRLLGDASFAIRPRKGQFIVFDKAAARLVGRIILPVPDARTKGVVLAPTIYGNVLVGPTAEEQDARDVAAVERAALCALKARAVQIAPALDGMPVTAVYAGLRPASDDKAYRIRHEPARRWLTLGGVRSTGLTAALGLARYATDLIAGGADWEAPQSTRAVRMPNLAEHLPRDWTAPGYGEIVCHCEMVTGREIEAAFASPLPPRDFGGLKRRTRAGMGRCQGFYCGAKLADVTRGRLNPPLAAG